MGSAVAQSASERVGRAVRARCACARSNPLKPEGDWVSKIDLIQEGDQLLLGMQPTHGHCKKECRTIEYTCEGVIDKADTEFTEIRAPRPRSRTCARAHTHMPARSCAHPPACPH